MSPLSDDELRIAELELLVKAQEKTIAVKNKRIGALEALVKRNKQENRELRQAKREAERESGATKEELARREAEWEALKNLPF